MEKVKYRQEGKFNTNATGKKMHLFTMVKFFLITSKVINSSAGSVLQ